MPVLSAGVFLEGVSTSILGISIVFAVLFILVLALKILKGFIGE